MKNPSVQLTDNKEENAGSNTLTTVYDFKGLECLASEHGEKAMVRGANHFGCMHTTEQVEGL